MGVEEGAEEEEEENLKSPNLKNLRVEEVGVASLNWVGHLLEKSAVQHFWGHLQEKEELSLRFNHFFIDLV